VDGRLKVRRSKHASEKLRNKKNNIKRERVENVKIRSSIANVMKSGNQYHPKNNLVVSASAGHLETIMKNGMNRHRQNGDPVKNIAKRLRNRNQLIGKKRNMNRNRHVVHLEDPNLLKFPANAAEPSWLKTANVQLKLNVRNAGAPVL
jgi:hypothetical protein